MSDDQHFRSAVYPCVRDTQLTLPSIDHFGHSGAGAARATIDLWDSTSDDVPSTEFLMVLHECDNFPPIPHGTP